MVILRGSHAVWHYSQVVTAVDSNLVRIYQLLFEGAGSNPAGVGFFFSHIPGLTTVDRFMND